jgi:hypothetical protein
MLILYKGVFMTRQFTHPEKFDPFEHWLHSRPFPLDSKRICVTDLDFIVQAFRNNFYLYIETKTYGRYKPNREPSTAQQDTLSLAVQSALHASGRAVRTGLHASLRRVTFEGMYSILVSDTSPEDSSWGKINGKYFNQEKFIVVLEQILRTGYYPHVPRLPDWKCLQDWRYSNKQWINIISSEHSW